MDHDTLMTGTIEEIRSHLNDSSEELYDRADRYFPQNVPVDEIDGDAYELDECTCTIGPMASFRRITASFFLETTVSAGVFNTNMTGPDMGRPGSGYVTIRSRMYSQVTVGGGVVNQTTEVVFQQ